jgi:hypothetical protein
MVNMVNIDVSPTAIAEFKKHVPQCQVVLGWRIGKRSWLDSSFELASERWLKHDGAALVFVTKEGTGKADRDFFSRALDQRAVVQLVRDRNIACMMVYFDEDLSGKAWLEELKSLKLTTSTLLIYAPGQKKPTVLTSNATAKEVVAALHAATAKRPKP